MSATIELEHTRGAQRSASLQAVLLMACLLAGAILPQAVPITVLALAAAAVLDPGAAVALALSIGLLKGSGTDTATSISLLPLDMTTLAAALLGLNALLAVVFHRFRLRLAPWNWLLVLGGVLVAVSAALGSAVPSAVLFSAAWRYVLISVPMALLTGFLCGDRGTFRTAVRVLLGLSFVWVGAALRTMLSSQTAVASVGSVDYVASATWASLAVLGILGPALAGWERSGWWSLLPAFPASAVLVGAPSRGILAATAGVLAGTALRGTRSLRSAVRRLLLLGLVTGALLGTYTFLARTRAGMSVERLRVWSLTSSSISVRLSLWREAWEEFIGSPIVGAGIGATEARLGIGSYPHGLPQQVLAELGLVGLAIFLPLWIAGICASIRLITGVREGSRQQDPEMVVLAAWVIVLAIDCLVSSSLADARTFLLALAAVVAAEAGLRSEQPPWQEAETLPTFAGRGGSHQWMHGLW